jgi:ribonuclease P protein component
MLSGGGERLPRARRITTTSDIRTLLRRGQRSRTSHLDVFAAESSASHARVGLIVPRHRHRIVERNLLKRRLRETLRREVLPRLAATGLRLDVLVRARREAYDAPFMALRDELVGWTERRCSRGSFSS